MVRLFLPCLLLSCCIARSSPAQTFTFLDTSGGALRSGDGRSVNFLDINGDGFDDLFLSNGPKGGENNVLYLNDGKGGLFLTPAGAITDDGAPSDGAAFADADNDGDPDAFVVTWYGEPNHFYRNEGRARFSEAAMQSFAHTGTFSETASWIDLDHDGRLDLFISNSTDFRTNTPSIRRNLLYHQQADGHFIRIDTGALSRDAHISRAVSWVDYDGDGDPDLFVSNEENQPNSLYRNEGKGFFRPVRNALTADSLASTGASWGDVDNDGDLDCFVANFLDQPNQLFLNDGRGHFTLSRENPFEKDRGCSFGSAFGDYDNDGDLDLFVTNAFCRDSLQNFFYVNDGEGRFARDSSAFPMLATRSSYGVAWGDLDNDGFLDLAVANCRKSGGDPAPLPAVFRNGGGNGKHWIRIKLKGTASNRSAIGAVVQVRSTMNGESIRQMRMIESQSGYCSQNGLYAHFGLDEARKVEELRILWPSGKVTTLQDLQTDQILEVTE